MGRFFVASRGRISKNRTRKVIRAVLENRLDILDNEQKKLARWARESEDSDDVPPGKQLLHSDYFWHCGE
ncbi:hypothetical protein MYCTH_2124981 [Thermothelomyces thermophilus ATCC 42464]|uniref:Uncharacterized protein n=1 Tax=Thermothelomyces thermophilus (strain ATCC 42464 / BCRC 31852 / DSM 1799) TaxID=573729 RepID=G2Q799_THET4|nr:uncharacterized protein MYCTH_2124981 [Thermothelomyces thermophilus ATCC 42464]AEO56010.1 hypothetical protein MYCTH_2124981 [Thermothelomyces thermophilus ATCC 42464]